MKKILIIDDDRDFRELLRLHLERAGYETSQAQDGRRGIDAFRLFPADLVIIDLFMPEKDGLESINELKKEFPRVKIIAISGGGAVKNFDYLHVAEHMGADKAIAKPFDKDVLLRAVASLI